MPIGEDYLELAGQRLAARLLLGSAGYSDLTTLFEAIDASGALIVTASIRRIALPNRTKESLWQQLKSKNLQILPNTAGCYTASEAVLTAKLAREALETNWIKLEVIGEEQALFPDVEELLKAARQLVHEGFVVLAYCNDDPITCRKLADLGCAAVMPLGAPIGSGLGLLNPYNLEFMRQTIAIPLILDAGIGTASDAALAMELGFDAVLVNTAIAQAENPPQMALAMKYAVQAGRLAYLSGRIPKKRYARASSPREGRIGQNDQG